MNNLPPYILAERRCEMIVLLLAVAFVAFVAFIYLTLKPMKKAARRKLPPGPPGLPVLGNILQLPALRPHPKASLPLTTRAHTRVH